ncbi:MAG: spore coat associated protein CotJA [Xylanivirga thermophila]|jgi:hypothetical protein|uniref:spore coat associated protein CotJA n=1 Tax=Xylanivirga thermophila TaxID=2496273 RepID=UPI00101BEED1|nr:spore coat associated protein CotJA [Xylanivirga thermophila]
MNYDYSVYNYGQCIPRPQPRPYMPNGELARAYIPYQQYTRSFSPMEALKHGTMFPELVRPYKDYRYEGANHYV